MLLAAGGTIWATLLTMHPIIIACIGIFLLVLGWVMVGLYTGEAQNPPPKAKTELNINATSDSGADDLVEIGQYKVSRSLLEGLIHFGYPQQRAGDPTLSWWQIPIMLNRIEGCAVRELKSCRVFLSESLKQVKMRWRSDRPDGDDATDLRLGKDAKFVPIIARSEKGFTFRVVDGRGISTQPGPAIITDEAFLLRANLATTLEYNKFISGQSITTGYRLSIEIHCEEWLWRKYYWIYVPQNDVSNGHFIMFPSPLEGDDKVEVRRRSGSVI